MLNIPELVAHPFDVVSEIQNDAGQKIKDNRKADGQKRGIDKE